MLGYLNLIASSGNCKRYEVDWIWAKLCINVTNKKERKFWNLDYFFKLKKRTEIYQNRSPNIIQEETSKWITHCHFFSYTRFYNYMFYPMHTDGSLKNRGQNIKYGSYFKHYTCLIFDRDWFSSAIDVSCNIWTE